MSVITANIPACCSSDDPGELRYLLALHRSNKSSSCRARQRQQFSLHAQVPGGGHLARAASDRGDRQAAEEQVHGWEEGLEEADGAEGGASVRSEVDLVGVGAGRLQRGLVLAARPGWKDDRRSLKHWIFFRVGYNSQLRRKSRWFTTE